jgi:hypothetical protein
VSGPILVYVYDGQRCLGHLLSRGKTGVEAFDQSLGLFPDQHAAANAIWKKRNENSGHVTRKQRVAA